MPVGGGGGNSLVMGSRGLNLPTKPTPYPSHVQERPGAGRFSTGTSLLKNSSGVKRKVLSHQIRVPFFTCVSYKALAVMGRSCLTLWVWQAGGWVGGWVGEKPTWSVQAPTQGNLRQNRDPALAYRPQGYIEVAGAGVSSSLK